MIKVFRQGSWNWNLDLDLDLHLDSSSVNKKQEEVMCQSVFVLSNKCTQNEKRMKR